MYSSLPGEPGGSLEGLGEIAAPLLREEAEKKGKCVFLLGVSAGPTRWCSPVEGMSLALRH